LHLLKNIEHNPALLFAEGYTLKWTVTSEEVLEYEDNVVKA